jgi:hypothetical protein
MDPALEEALFALALQKPPERRAAFLDAVCEGDPRLRDHLEALLDAHARPATLLATGNGRLTGPTAAPRSPGNPDVTLDDAVGRTFDRYKLLERIGEGGCGVVYAAEQIEPVRRRVALKVIKPGMDSRSILARFEAERQALARMDHPNIARVLEKVIDFGIAKAIEGRLTDSTVHTHLHQFVGTPAYMSPEQAEMSGLDIDTRSDIYSLGVLLYELLTGTTPFDPQELPATAPGRGRHSSNPRIGLHRARRIRPSRSPLQASQSSSRTAPRCQPSRNPPLPPRPCHGSLVGRRHGRGRTAHPSRTQCKPSCPW